MKPSFPIRVALLGVLMIVQPSAFAQKCVNVPAGLVGWWRAEGNANDSRGANHGTLSGGTFFSAAEVGQGFALDSNDDGASIPHNDALNINAFGFTAEFWMQGIKNQPDSLYLVVDKSHGWTDSTGWVFQGNSASGLISFGIGEGGAGSANFGGISSAVDVLDGNFHHIAGTWGEGEMRLYVDGVFQGNTALATPANNTRPMNIGYSWGGGTPSRFFRGQLDELSIYNRALSAGEIQGVFNAGSAGKCSPACVTPPSGMVGWWPNDGNAYDLIGANNGALRNGADFAPGEVDQGLSLDGVDDYAQVVAPCGLPVGNAPRTIDLWFKTSRDVSVSTESALVQYGSLSAGQMFGLITSANARGKLYFYGYSPTFPLTFDLSSTTTLSPDVWYHGAVTYDGTTIRLYLNGNLEASKDAVLDTVLNSQGLTIGLRPEASAYWQGLIDEVEIFNRALSPTEIQAIFNAGGAGKCKPAGCTITSITCPTNVVVSATAGESGAIVNYSPPPTSEGCGAVTCLPPSGSLFSVGTNTVTCTATDGCGHVNFDCAFSVIVQPGSDCAALPPGLVAWWPGNGNTRDVVNGNDGILVGNVGFAPGPCGLAFDLRGSGYVSVPEAPPFDFGPQDSLTALAWVYRTGSGSQHFFGKRAGCGNSPFYQDCICPGGYAEADIPFQQWMLVAITLDRCTATSRLWVNGQIYATGSAVDLDPQNDADFRIGTSGGCEPFDGLLYNMMIFNRALTQAEMTLLYAGGCGAACLLPPPDTEPLQIICPTNLTTICNVRNGATVNFAVTVTGECDTNVSVVCTPPSGSVFPFGTTTVNCTATNAIGHMANCSFTVTVIEPFLRIALDGEKVVVTWDGNGTLQYTDELLGDGPPTVWLDVPGNPASPYSAAPSEARRFYRVSACHD